MNQQETWIESGKQIGKSISFTKNEEPYRQSVAIQKHQNEYYVYFFEVPEAKMMLDEDAEEESLKSFSEIHEALEYLSQITHIPFADFAPFKGQKAFKLQTD
jgi:hypothetical protein